MTSQSGYHDAGSSGFGNSKLGPRDLPSKRLLGTGLASVGYETELNGKKYARKDFMGVPSGTFRREAARLVGLEDHVNVVKTLDWTENNMSCSLVLEYMDDDLLGFLQKRKQSQGSMEAVPISGNQSDLDSRNAIKLAPFELPEALDFMLQIARGMEYLADKGIRHGNLKTKNILVTCTNDRDREWSVKVADFGLVRTRRKSTSFASRQARKLDMARWTAPEILQVFLLEDEGETSSESDSDEDCTDSSDVADSDVPEWRELGADVHSFAVICSQILTGEDPYPYPNLNWKELGVNIVRYGLLPTLPATCPPELSELLESCWRHDRPLRYVSERPSFSHICRTLERLQRMELGGTGRVSVAGNLSRDVWKAPMDVKTVAGAVIKRKTPMDIERTTPMDTYRKVRVRDVIPGKELADVVRVRAVEDLGDLRDPITVEDLWDLRDPITVEGPWGFRVPIIVEDPWEPEWTRDPITREVDAWDVRRLLHLQSNVTFAVARLIARTRTVQRRTEWNQLRKELELMLPDLLRMRNRWVCYVRALDGEGSDAPKTFGDHWVLQLGSTVHGALAEVEMQEEVDQLLPLSLSSGLMAPQRVSNHCNDINRLAKMRKKVLLDLAKLLRHAVRAKEEKAKQATHQEFVFPSAWS